MGSDTIDGLPLSPRGRGREAMTYGGLLLIRAAQARVAVSHSAELVRGDYLRE